MSLLSLRPSLIDAALSALLRYDLSRTDLVKWVSFARQVLLVILASVMTTAALSAVVSVRQASAALRDSLFQQANAVAKAVASAAFVPLILRDDRALEALLDSYRGLEHLSELRIFDADGRIVRELPTVPARRQLRVRVPILAPPEEDYPQGRGTPVGFAEAGLRTDWIETTTARVALTNAALSGGVIFLVAVIGFTTIGRLVDRTRELVGEAKLIAEIRRVNAELESFSYSVAHDLRAPLRAIDGFSQALLDGYADRLDAEGKDYLYRVRAGSARMADLIDDILKLSRVTRSVPRSEAVDLSALASDIVAGLRAAEPTRDVSVSVAPGLSATGDPALLRLALENLLGNAWKYTRKRAGARVEFLRLRREGQDVFVVRDNGAGFDMAFSDKLFKPFSRLHSAREFEGTGVGLATVQRVIQRHGGDIWAEAALDQGAAFYFTLGP